MRIRDFFYRQLAVGGWRGGGISPANAVIVGLILLTLLLQILQTEPVIRESWGRAIDVVDLVLLGIFTVEYGLRVWVAGCDPQFAGLRGRVRYVFSFHALIDLLAILPSYLALLALGAFDTKAMRALRLLRVLRFARFGAFSTALRTMAEVFRSRIYELTVSLLIAVTMLVLASTVMYFVERDANPAAFGSIPRAPWWSVVTMTTVGHGDATPVTPLGKLVAGVVAVIAIALVAIPTGILAASFSNVIQRRKAERHATSRPPRRRPPPMVS